jgi:hypothetical protein
MDKIKAKLISLYNSSEPYVFAQIHANYDDTSHKVWTSSSRVYDLRKGAQVQILFPDGMPDNVAIEYLQDAIRHIEMFGLPKGPLTFPDGSDAEGNG